MLSHAALPLALFVAVETTQQVAFSLAAAGPRRRIAWLGCGIGLHVVLLALWCWLLLLLPLGVAAPLTATSYLTIPLAGRWFLGERVSPWSWIGMLSIAIGFAVVAG